MSDPVVTPAAPLTIAPIEAQGIPEGDVRHQLVGRPFDKIAPPGMDNERAFLVMLQESITNSRESTTGTSFSLRDLPPEVAAKILDDRADAMKDFFESWAASIKDNAEADLETALKAAQQRALLAKVLVKAKAHLPVDVFNELAERAGVPTIEANANNIDSARVASANMRPREPLSAKNAMERPELAPGTAVSFKRTV